MSTERSLSRVAGWPTTLIEVLLDAIHHPAHVVTTNGRVVLSNMAGARQLIQPEAVRKIRAALRAPEEHLDIEVRVAAKKQNRSVPSHARVLVIMRGADSRIDSAASAWQLTPRERDVLTAVVRGEGNKAIAATLGCSARTVEKHLCSIFVKSHASSRSELAFRVLGCPHADNLGLRPNHPDRCRASRDVGRN